MNTACNIRFCMRFVCSVSVAGIGFLSGCASNAQYCGVEYSDNYDISKGVLPYPPNPSPAVVVPYTTRDIKANPYFYPPQPPLGCISYDDVRN